MSLSLLLAPAAQAQVVWQTEVGGTSVTELLRRPDESLIVVGTGQQRTSTTNFVDVYVTAFSAEGDSLWQTPILTDGVEGQDFPYDAAVDASGNVYVVGSTNKGERWDEQGIVVKLAPDGTEAWRYEFGATGVVEDIAYAVRLTSDGGVIVAGTTNGPGGDVFSVFRLAAADGSLVWRGDHDASTDGKAEYGGMTLTPTGKVVQHGAAFVALAFGKDRLMPTVVVFSDADGSLETSAVFETDEDQTNFLTYVTDDCAGSGESLWCIGGTFNAFFGSIDPDATYRLRRYDADGTQAVDEVVFPDSAWVVQSISGQVAVDGQGRVWIAGVANVPSQQDRERVLIMYDGDFELIDRAPISGLRVTDLAIGDDGSVWLSYHPLGDDGRATGVQRVEQFAPSGQKLWHYNLPEASDGPTVSLLPADDGRIHVAYSRTIPPGGGPNFRHSLLLLEPPPPTSTGDPVAPDLATLHAVAPNPASGDAQVAFDLAAPAPVSLVAYDVLGRRVATLAEGTLPAGHHVRSLDTTSLTPGTYLLRLVLPQKGYARTFTVSR